MIEKKSRIFLYLYKW